MPDGTQIESACDRSNIKIIDEDLLLEKFFCVNLFLQGTFKWLDLHRKVKLPQ